MPFTLLQITDTHLPADPATPYRGQNADDNLKSLIPACRALKPDGLVLTGDISDDYSAPSYQRIAVLLGDLCPNIGWVPGNHDDRSEMEKVFDSAGWSAGPVLNWGGWQIVLLDSAVHKRIEGHLDEPRLKPLDTLDKANPALVFVHHQPMPIGAPWIDKYPLVNPEKFWEKLDPAVVRIVACGHVHQAFAGEHKGIPCLSTPSAAVNSQPATKKFTPDPTGPKARWFRLWPDGQWKTGLVSAG